MTSFGPVSGWPSNELARTVRVGVRIAISFVAGCVAISRPFESNVTPFAPLVFSRKEVRFPCASTLVMTLAVCSVNRRLPSGAAIGPSVPRSPWATS